MPPRLSAGVVLYRPSDARFLLLRAFTHWDFPKGGVEPGEDTLTTARREVREETGVEDLRFAWGEHSFDTKPYARGKVARYYLAATAAQGITLGVNPTLGRAEHHEYRWVTFDEANRLVGPRVREVLAWAHRLISSPGADTPR